MPPSFLIRKSWDQRPFAGFPRLIAGYRVLRRLSMPRHPPCTLSSLTTVTDHRREPLGKARAVRTADNGSDQFHVGFASGPPRCCRTGPSTIPLAKKVLDDPLAQNGKDLAPADAQERAGGKPNARGSRILRDVTRAGDKKCPSTSPKPSVEPLFTCQRAA